ncbi:MAG: hypothetical protein HY704_09410 [Gemmatimonadetes bacterium]|nr:hypothetical protein [Gemmatimonadota bacterium]
MRRWDIRAVRPGFQNRQLGTRLKLFQRELLLSRRVTRVQWTFDPWSRGTRT